jgi:DNA polymerase-3 subunit epsilon
MYAIVDIETTGGYAENHRVTEIAIYHHDGLEITGHYKTLINPGRKIPQFITGLTGITYEMVKEAPSFESVGHEILGWLKDRVFVAHNAHFDYSFLRKEFEAMGITWSSKKLCTVRLGRKIIPGLTSYGLGRLAESLGVVIEDRHRAGGDAHATAKIFDTLLKRDQHGAIKKALQRNSGETILPPNLPKEDFDTLPARAGVYYFHDLHGKVIYVGKAINIKKRIAGHFTGEAREWNRSNIRNEIHHVSYELTGNELIALILEAQEIRRLWPRYNLAQKYRLEEWGIYDYEDRNGYLRFNVSRVTRGATPLITFANKGDAWNFMWEKVRLHTLCPRLSGLQLAKGPCFAHQAGTCNGACEGIEGVSEYNTRAQSAVDSFYENGTTLAIVGQGRSPGERSLVVVEKGNYLGYGFIGPEASVTDLDSARTFIKPARESRIAQNLVNSFLRNPKGAELLPLN